MNLLAVTLSRHEETWDFPEIPLFCFTEDRDTPNIREEEYRRLKQTYNAKAYITYLASRRTKAIETGLARYPKTTDVLMCDSYYLHQADSLKQLISDYQKVGRLGITAALGGAVWGTVKTKLKHYLKPSIKWYDKWAVPELAFAPYGWRPETDNVAKMFTPPLPGLYFTSSLSGVAIWPRSIWDKGARFGIFDDLHGCELNYFYESAGIPRYTDLNAVFWRNTVYPFSKALRHSLHLGRFLRR